ncbi:MAG TPA: hypothetical protein VH539_20470 [Gemmatimonadaceae bacterium]|jgi:hypothetical protein
MRTEKNLAKVFAMALRKVVADLRASVWISAPWAPVETAYTSIESIAEELEKYSADGEAHDWQGSYELLRDAIAEHLGDYIEEDDVAEEAIYVAAIERVAVLLGAQQESGTCDACQAESDTLLVVESVAGAPGRVCSQCVTSIPLIEPDPDGGRG